ncbi:hypothetical protein AB0G35_12995 [Streptomyces sp. NPDC021749]|uniref:hypothetical protein n=1 Tax=Streptomyces sp. NPDC021749 TaxID=3154905 RepID=UPI00340E37BE
MTAPVSRPRRPATERLTLGVQDYDALYEPEFTVDPEELTQELIDFEQARRGLA